MENVEKHLRQQNVWDDDECNKVLEYIPIRLDAVVAVMNDPRWARWNDAGLLLASVLFAVLLGRSLRQNYFSVVVDDKR